MTAPFGEQPTRVVPSGPRRLWRDDGRCCPDYCCNDCPSFADVTRPPAPPPNPALAATIDDLDDAPQQEWDWPRACPWCGVTVPVGVPTVAVDGEHVCQECAQ